MTFIGKLFVMLNLVLSLLMAATAFSLYSTNTDPTDKAAQAGNPPGKLVPLRAEIDELYKQIALAEGNWASLRYDLYAKEDRGQEDRKFYVDELKKLYPADAGRVRTVDPKNAETPVRLQDVMIDVAPELLPQEAYIKQLKDHQEENRKLREALEAKIKEDTDLTNELTGDPEKKNRGLRQKIGDERIKRQGILDEQKIEEGLKVNAEFDSELILNRLELLEKRIRELKLYLKKKHNVDVDAKGL